jgi:CDP-4-dehydro-6-deoxyglucose reductase
MLRHVLEGGVDRPLHLYWGARQAQDVYEEQLVREWLRRYPQLRFTPVLSEETRTDYRAGLVHEAVLADYPDLEAFDVYAAGPPALIEAIRADFPRTDRLFFDSFDYAVDAGGRGSDTKPLP